MVTCFSVQGPVLGLPAVPSCDSLFVDKQVESAARFTSLGPKNKIFGSVPVLKILLCQVFLDILFHDSLSFSKNPTVLPDQGMWSLYILPPSEYPPLLVGTNSAWLPLSFSPGCLGFSPCLRKGKSPPHFQYFRITFQLHLITLFSSNSSSWVGMVEVLFSNFLLIFKMITSILFQCIKKGSCKIILVLTKKDSSGEYLARSKQQNKV